MYTYGTKALTHLDFILILDHNESREPINIYCMRVVLSLFMAPWRTEAVGGVALVARLHRLRGQQLHRHRAFQL